MLQPRMLQRSCRRGPPRGVHLRNAGCKAPNIKPSSQRSGSSHDAKNPSFESGTVRINNPF